VRRKPSIAAPGPRAAEADASLEASRLLLDYPEGSGAGPNAMGTRDPVHPEATSVESPVARRASMPRMATAPSDHPAPGTILGSYQLLALLGHGGMGYVYRAVHVVLGREVALKLLRPDRARRRDAVARFFQEARAVNRVRHRNIVDVPDFVELVDGTTFIVMELLHGETLGAWARSGVSLPAALAAMVQVCDGLEAAHRVGVIHRDLKPDNIFVVTTADGELLKLLDFGVAKLAPLEDETVGHETAAGTVVGTPAYMSPEQASGLPVDVRSDVYSLGAIMYELFCGHPPFRAQSFGEYVRKQVTERPVPPRQTRGGAELDPELEDMILRCLEKDPAARFANVAELRMALAVRLTGRRPVHRPATPAAPAPVVRRAPWWLWASGVTAALGIGVALAAWGMREGAPEPAPPAAPMARTEPRIEPIVVPVPPVRITIDSRPSGAVFAGRTELCRTRCVLELDPGRGRQSYVVRAPGYRDAVVDVEPATSDTYTLVLEPLARQGAPTQPAAAPAREPEPIDKNSIDPTELKDPFARKPE
jgi:eukaryotic-like serine/threonine-protein kinase